MAETKSGWKCTEICSFSRPHRRLLVSLSSFTAVLFIKPIFQHGELHQSSQNKMGATEDSLPLTLKKPLGPELKSLQPLTDLAGPICSSPK